MQTGRYPRRRQSEVSAPSPGVSSQEGRSEQPLGYYLIEYRRRQCLRERGPLPMVSDHRIPALTPNQALHERVVRIGVERLGMPSADS